MRRIVFLLLVAASLCGARPRYGGTLVIEMHAAPAWLTDVEASRVAGLVFENLVRLDDRGEIRPWLAKTWSHDATLRRWQFSLRPGVKMHDGNALTAQLAASALATSMSAIAPALSFSAAGDAVVVTTARAAPEVPLELARRWAAIATRANGISIGTGPFRIHEWAAGRHALLNAFEDHWEGRPYLDAVEIRMNRSWREQAADLEAGRADVVELAPADIRRLEQRSRGTWSSQPLDLVALLFARDRPPAQNESLRRAIALAIDRPPISNVLLQKFGDASGGMLPNWLSGYGFVFPSRRDLAGARALITAPPPTLTLGFDANDPILRPIAERLALNARDAGIILRPAPGAGDVVLVRAAAKTPQANLALGEYCEALGFPAPGVGAGADALYQVEKRLLDGRWIVPLLHVPSLWGLSARVRNWTAAGGAWRMEEVWVQVGP